MSSHLEFPVYAGLVDERLSFGDWLIDQWDHLGRGSWSAERFARELGVSGQAVRDWLDGAKPRRGVVLKIARALNVPVNEVKLRAGYYLSETELRDVMEWRKRDQE